MVRPLISVIIPVYNTEQFLPVCLDSVIGQTYKNLEIIIINDGSVDNSMDICEQYALHDQRIKIISQSNRGLSAARNTGIDNACGEYIIFVDSDDYISLDTIEMLLRIMLEYNADCSICGYACVDESRNIIKTYYISNQCEISGIEALKKYYFDNTYEINFVTAWGKLFRRELWNKLRFKENIVFEDIDIMPSILLQCEKIVVSDIKCGYYYVQRSGSIMSSQRNKKYYKDAIDIFERHIELYDTNKLFRFRDAEICLLCDKIITSDCHNSIPKDYIYWVRELYLEKYKKLNKSTLKLEKRIRYTVYRYMRGLYVFLWKKFKRNV